MSMTRSKIEAAVTEARRFIIAAQAAIERIDAEREQHAHRYGLSDKKQPNDQSWGSTETGSLRRRSLDLTRSLAELRK